MSEATVDDAEPSPDTDATFPRDAAMTNGIPTGLTRRNFVGTVAMAGSAVAVAAPESLLAQAPPAPVPARAMAVTLTINATEHRLTLKPRATLLDTLREGLGLTGAKVGCNHGQCGACTVLIDGRRALSCLTLAVAARGKAITTIEGLATGDTLHPVQQAFIDHDAFQCGYCTPGQIMSAVALDREPVGRADADVAEAMSGNLCRCGAYPNIVAAVQATRGSRARG